MKHALPSASLLLQAFPLYIFVVVAVLVVCLPRARELRVLLVAMLASVLVNVALKALLRQPRPAPWNCDHIPRWGSDAMSRTHGMPSGHAQLCATVATVLVLLSWEYTEWIRRSVVLAGAVCIVTCMVISRTSVSYTHLRAHET